MSTILAPLRKKIGKKRPKFGISFENVCFRGKVGIENVKKRNRELVKREGATH